MRKKINTLLTFLILNIYNTSLPQVKPDFSNDEYFKLVVIFTNDIHGGIGKSKATFINPDFPPIIGGGEVASRYIFKVREEATRNGYGFLLLDAGDIYQGTPVGTLTKGKAVVEYMNYVKYDAVCVGNHDFDDGWENLKKLAEYAKFPFLGANIYRKSTDKLAEFVKPYIMKEFDRIKIAIVSVTTSLIPEISYPEHIKDLEFKNEVEVLRKLVPEVKKKGADIVILSTHSYLPYNLEEAYKNMLKKIETGYDFTKHPVSAMEIAHAVPDIDIIFSGHVHKGFYEPWEDPDNHTLIFQNYANGTNLGHVIFYIHKKTKTLAGYNFVDDRGAIFTLFEDEFYPDTILAKKLDSLIKVSERGLDEVIGIAIGNFTRSREGESSMGNLVVDAMREAVRADVAFSNYGGIRADLQSGPITPRDIFRVMPFENRIVVVNVTGNFIKELIEDKVSGSGRGMLISGCRVVIDKTKPDREKVVELKIGGQTFIPSKIYKLAVTDYLLEGNSGFVRLTTIPSSQINYTGIMVRQAIINYISKHSPLKPTIDWRWKIVNHIKP